MTYSASIITKDGNLLFNEDTGSSSFNKLDDLNFYDTDSGKWYRSVFDIEQAFWASKFYYVPEIDGLSEYDDVIMEFKPVEMVYTPTEMDMSLLETKPQLIGALDGTVKASWSHYYEPEF